jgi:hypothetical protein
LKEIDMTIRHVVWAVPAPPVCTALWDQVAWDNYAKPFRPTDYFGDPYSRERLKDEYEEYANDMLKEKGMECSIWADLLNRALSEVNWGEIAWHYISDVEIEEENGNE